MSKDKEGVTMQLWGNYILGGALHAYAIMHKCTPTNNHCECWVLSPKSTELAATSPSALAIMGVVLPLTGVRKQAANDPYTAPEVSTKDYSKTKQYQFPVLTYSPDNSTIRDAISGNFSHKFWLYDTAENWNLCECSSFLCTVMCITVCLSDTALLLHYSMDAH